MCDGAQGPIDSNLLIMEPLSNAYDLYFFGQLQQTSLRR
jgi:hypothetical protein